MSVTRSHGIGALRGATMMVAQKKGSTMLDNQGFQTDPMNMRIAEGTPVLDVNGDKVGEVASNGVQSTALIVKKGLLFTKEVYVPLSIITGQDADGVHLSMEKSEIKHQNWDMPPIADNSTNAGVDNPMTGGVAGAGLNDMPPGGAYGAMPEQQRNAEGYLGTEYPEEDPRQMP